jgi:hypothetical protein
MPEVVGGNKEPFVIYRDNSGGWHCDFTRNQYGHEYDWADDIKATDALAVRFKGEDFSRGSYPFVYDAVLSARVREEYYDDMREGRLFGETQRERYALVNFFQENIGTFSRKAIDYLTTLERPLTALDEMAPFSMAANFEGMAYDEESAQEAIDYIENEVNDRLVNYDDPDKRVIDGYEERQSIQLAGRLVILAENQQADDPYFVCFAKWDNPLGATEYYDVGVTDDYVEAMRQFVDNVDSLLISLENERAAFGLAPQTFTAADCIPDSLNENLNGKAIVIKPEAFAPEYRSAEHQIQICLGGFGASANSRGTAVFCRNLYSGTESQFKRNDVAGIIDPARTPQWAARKLAFLDAAKEPGVFEYGGYHFKPLRQFRKGEAYRKLKGDSRGKADMQFAMRNMKDDPNLRIDWTGYTPEKFYEVSGSDADIFQCVENGKLYVPCSGKLFEYSEPLQKENDNRAGDAGNRQTDAPVEICLTSASNDACGGVWLKLPVDATSLQEALKSVSAAKGVYSISAAVSSYEFVTPLLNHSGIDELNMLAHYLNRMEAWQTDKLSAIMLSGLADVGGAADLINLLQIDNFRGWVIDAVFSLESLGRTRALLADRDTLESLMDDGMDYAEYGELCQSDENGAFTDYGYVYHRTESAAIYTGVVPPEYKISDVAALPEPERKGNKKTSLLGRLDGAKAEAARQNAERADKPAPNKKRGDMEVD